MTTNTLTGRILTVIQAIILSLLLWAGYTLTQLQQSIVRQEERVMSLTNALQDQDSRVDRLENGQFDLTIRVDRLEQRQ